MAVGMAVDKTRYVLTVLTNNRPVYLERALSAFLEHVTPYPEYGVIMDDGGMTDGIEEIVSRCPWEWDIQRSDAAIGMCRAYTECWTAARLSGLDWAFHLEDDQVILRPTDLERLRRVLQAEERLAQMALVRCPWGAEIEFGGYIPQSPGWYHRRRIGDLEWIETTRNWATSPALFRTDLAREFDMPVIQCETAIGFAIREKYPEKLFGLWGWGEPWYAHIGVEKGARAYGY